MAGPDSGTRSHRDRRAGCGRAEGRDSRLRVVYRGPGQDCLGFGIHLPRDRHARRRQRGAHSPGAAERLGSKRPGGTGPRAGEPGGDPGRLQRCASGRQAGVPRRPDRSRRRRRHRAGSGESRGRRGGAFRARPHGRLAGPDRRGLLRPARADRGRVPQLLRRRQPPVSGGDAGGEGGHVEPDGSPRWRCSSAACGPWTPTREVRLTACSRIVPAR